MKLSHPATNLLLQTMTRTIIFLNLYFLSISILKAQSYFSKSFIPEMDNHGNNAYSLQKYEDG